MSGDVTIQALKRLTWLSNRAAELNGDLIAGQEYYDVFFTGGTISGVSILLPLISVVDDQFTIVDDVDPAKTAQFDASTVPTGLNVFAFPPTSTQLLGTDTAQTLTNKTIDGINNFLNVRLTADVSGILPVANGGTGANTLTGYVKGNGTSPFTASPTIPNTDITGLGTMSTQNSNNVNITGGAITGATLTTTPFGINLQDQLGDNTLSVLYDENATGNRTLGIRVNDANKVLTIAGNATVSGSTSGTNTGDQTITLTGNVTGTGTGSFATTIVTAPAMTGILNMAKGPDIASAATTNIAAATGNFMHVTGTTTITSFGTVQAGAMRTLEFDASLILTHNATSLILPTGANITTAAGDVAVFVSEGSGNWRCVSYTRVDGTSIAPAISNNQIFTSSGTWNKPSGFSANSKVLIRGWGGGAGGSDSGTSYNSGGGGGSYFELWLTLSQLGSSETVTVGSGGLAVENSQGQPGGDSSVGTIWYAYGGTNGTSGNSSNGGAGGSPFGRSANGTRTPVTDSIFFYPNQSYGRPLSGNESGRGMWNGGGGGGPGASASPGGDSVYGGGGGGGGNGTLSLGGVSRYGGNGGNGQGATQSSMNGSIPGGGGGGLYTSQPLAGNGARGQVEITVFI